MTLMFCNAESFNQDLSSWNVEKVLVCLHFSLGATSWLLPKPNFKKCSG